MNENEGDKMLAKDIPLEVALSEIPDKKIKQLRNKGFETVADLVNFLPRRYENRSSAFHTFTALANCIGKKVSVIGTVLDVYVDYRKEYLSVSITDGHGKKMAIKWYHQNYISKQIVKGTEYLFYGKIDFTHKYGYAINSPVFYSSDIRAAATPMPVYSKISGMSTEYLGECIHKALMYNMAVGCDDPVPGDIREKIGIDEVTSFLEKAHNPRHMQDVQAVEKRKTAETLLPFCVELTERKYETCTTSENVVERNIAQTAIQQFKNSLKFKLTADQDKTLETMCDIVSNGHRLDALVQGDVGCGKTMIAAGMTAIMAAGGYQTVIMAPTAILAGQHFNEFSERFSPLGYKVAFLGGKEKAKDKKAILDGIKTGEYKIIIGTHAVISQGVEFAALGMTIVDEEHRFGVAQRKLLREKALGGAHSISMSATPIPRSLALALYGDSTTVYNIHTMPSGRKPVTTIVFSDEHKTFDAVYRQIQQGRQAYIVCPLINANDSMEGVDSLEETLENATQYFSNRPDVHIACINGKMKADEIQSTISAFTAGQSNILLSTTIVEVGVNVPNATVMVVKNAERFGLAQLHQLRGRVGRGSFQSYCVLLSKDKLNARLQAMVHTSDGFEIAQADLEQRGTGNLVGTEQSGMDRAVDAMVGNPELFKIISEEIDGIMQGKLRYDRMRHMATVLKEKIS